MASEPDRAERHNKEPSPVQHAESPSIRFEEISGGNPEVKVEFRGQIYRLRVTKNGKLILNK